LDFCGLVLAQKYPPERKNPVEIKYLRVFIILKLFAPQRPVPAQNQRHFAECIHLDWLMVVSLTRALTQDSLLHIPVIFIIFVENIQHANKETSSLSGSHETPPTGWRKY
jgi:hypothetical protein